MWRRWKTWWHEHISLYFYSMVLSYQQILSCTLNKQVLFLPCHDVMPGATGITKQSSKCILQLCRNAPVLECTGVSRHPRSSQFWTRWGKLFTVADICRCSRSFIFLLPRHGFQPKLRRPGFFTLLCRRGQCWSAPAQLKIRRSIMFNSLSCWLDLEVEVAASTANSPCAVLLTH